MSTLKPLADGASREIPERRISGRRMVGLMFVFAVVLTGAMGLYWHYYTLPFRPLQNAIDAVFPGSSPRVTGGRWKGRDDQPNTLRVVVRCEFDPMHDEPRAEAMALKLFQIAREHTDLDRYDVFEAHLYQVQPEQENPTRMLRRPVDEWMAAISE